ncbi:LysM peptidoglycan-binding domain-containing protein [Paraflavitalea sp. CAU 1676]|uniref:LysM peptidoglycan-binding domain-containing protein n=1 Tax=Paraflavitalea sp. CAU 1676 TaxID=3032598 RepID=UPI0023DA0ABA|nr:LysM peptidoglycan-binding domain-containing protein [Paraflavitalea sp. CAU 1676]MDF2192074.1 LysM peptidoglycan-binding domain-containing protein [Paraflavitalea sp. CAU 1676]
MALQDKYKELVDAARGSGVTNLQVREQDNVLYVDGEAPSYSVKDDLWKIYDKIDPDYRASDLVLNITVAANATPEEYEVVAGDNLTKIGKKFGMTWKDIHAANTDLIKDPDKIQVGWKLKIPRK